jgi:hypothetical protein
MEHVKHRELSSESTIITVNWLTERWGRQTSVPNFSSLASSISHPKNGHPNIHISSWFEQ